MKVLFAVNNDEISEAIIKKYREQYKEILSYKNVYYFNAILKELQKDKTYDRVVISEDLEPFANNNYDTIDKFLFDKLDNISDEATNSQGNNTEIILICTDRRSKSDDMLIKLFGISIYNAIIGQDRSIDQVCKLINTPRTKKEAKIYYRIESDNVNYQSENENNVSEVEVQNILAHYKRLGKNEDKYVDSFNNIVSQYTDNQLKIIIRYLPMGVKAVLEEKSPKYQQLVEYNEKTSNSQQVNYNNYNTKRVQENPQERIKMQMIENESKSAKMSKPIIIPSSVDKTRVTKLMEQKEIDDEEEDIEDNILEDIIENNNVEDKLDIGLEPEIETNPLEENIDIIETPKRGRGRPRKNVPVEEKSDAPKRGRGRPRKNAPAEEKQEDVDLFGLSDEEDTKQEDVNLFDLDDEKDNTKEEDIDLFGLSDEKENTKQEDVNLFDLDDEEDNTKEEDIDLFGLNDEKENTKQEDVNLFDLNDEEDNIKVANTQKEAEPKVESISQNYANNKFDEEIQNTRNINDIIQTQNKPMEVDFTSLLTKDKKIVSFVGTTKNGTSFVVNNVAHLLASRGISTAVLDMTKTRNAYYIYTNSEEKLMETAKNCIYKLRTGVTDGIKINKNLDIYTSLPENNDDNNDIDTVLETLIKKYSVVLIDCDFDTPFNYFAASQEIYLVQSMDVLTIQPLTAFLRNLQSKGVLKQEKIKIVINKGVNIKSVPIKTLIGGISRYNDPSMTYMKELFDRDKVQYCIIPFELPNYIKYLDSLITCSITLNGYTKPFIAALNELGNMIYPLLNKPSYSPRGEKYKDNFSNEMNNTLNEMKRRYQ